MFMHATYEVIDGVLHTTVTGTYGAAEALELRGEIAHRVKKSGIRLGIVDLRKATITQTTFDIYEINTSLDGFIPKETRFAFVYNPGALSPELAEFSENVLVNAGYEARVCPDMHQALRWVKGEEG